MGFGFTVEKYAFERLDYHFCADEMLFAIFFMQLWRYPPIP